METPVPERRLLLAGQSLPELAGLLGSRARALEVLRWMHSAPAEGSVPKISAERWQLLLTRCQLPTAEVVERSVSEDGTTKFLLGLNGVQVETVAIPTEGRTTICVSSQSGCSRKCVFCATAKIGFNRNLVAGEILTQYLIAARAAPPDAPARNVVFMGMGEPMDNLDQVLHAVELLTQAPAPMLRAERITVSTSGILPGMERFLREGKASLALSLNATTDVQREALMPQTRQYPIAALMDALREDRVLNPKRFHFIEYVLFDGVNDTDEDADRMVALLAGTNSRVNLIPHNPFPGSPLSPPRPERMLAVQQRVAAAKIRCLVRMPRGQEISAACGQLARRRGEAA
ncbi:MAG: 23S rRNA (adenine(2503)-C(2))-methyltransferase RlmN [Myxococcota bacterium]|nr:23S rRNA (adenine(2503)-C(2))-methyltransferase RlmN [Myxococcota bacterium]